MTEKTVNIIGNAAVGISASKIELTENVSAEQSCPLDGSNALQLAAGLIRRQLRASMAINAMTIRFLIKV